MFDAAAGMNVTDRLLPRKREFLQARLKGKNRKTATAFTNGRGKCVFWRKWVVWLKDGAFLRR
jgi:hypothetical protein